MHMPHAPHPILLTQSLRKIKNKSKSALRLFDVILNAFAHFVTSDFGEGAYGYDMIRIMHRLGR